MTIFGDGEDAIDDGDGNHDDHKDCDAQGQHQGVSPDIAKSLAEALSVPLQLVPFPGPGAFKYSTLLSQHPKQA